MPESTRTEPTDAKPRDERSGSKRDPSIVQLLITSKEGLEEIRSSWNDLAARTSAMIQSTADWNLLWWNHFGQGEGRSLYVNSYWTSGRLVGLCPWYIGASKVGRSVLQKRVRLIGSGSFEKELFGFTDHYGISDFLDILAEEPLASLIAGKIADQIQQKDSSIDFYQFLHVRDDSFIARHLLPELDRRGVNPEVKVSDHCPTIRIGSHKTVDDFIQTRPSGNSRRRIRQSIRLDDEHSLHVERVNDPERLNEAFHHLVALHQRRWNRLGMPGVFYDARFKRFSQSLFQKALEEGQFLGFLTRSGNEVVAVRFALLFNGRVFDFLTGFSDDHPSSRYRPGIMLLTRILQESLRLKCESIELLRGTESYKFDYTDEFVLNHQIDILTKQGRSKWLRHSALIFVSKVNHLLKREWTLLSVHLGVFGRQGYRKYLKNRLDTLQKKKSIALMGESAKTRGIILPRKPIALIELRASQLREKKRGREQVKNPVMEVP